MPPRSSSKHASNDNVYSSDIERDESDEDVYIKQYGSRAMQRMSANAAQIRLVSKQMSVNLKNVHRESIRQQAARAAAINLFKHFRRVILGRP